MYFISTRNKETVMVNRILVLKLAVIALFFILAVPNVDPMNWEPFLPYGAQGISAGAAIVFFAYIGFDAVATSAGKAKNPDRDLPIGILGSLGVCAVLYFFVALVLTGIVPYSDLNTRTSSICTSCNRLSNWFCYCCSRCDLWYYYCITCTFIWSSTYFLCVIS